MARKRKRSKVAPSVKTVPVNSGFNWKSLLALCPSAGIGLLGRGLDFLGVISMKVAVLFFALAVVVGILPPLIWGIPKAWAKSYRIRLYAAAIVFVLTVITSSLAVVLVGNSERSHDDADQVKLEHGNSPISDELVKKSQFVQPEPQVDDRSTNRKNADKNGRRFFLEYDGEKSELEENKPLSIKSLSGFKAEAMRDESGHVYSEVTIKNGEIFYFDIDTLGEENLAIPPIGKKYDLIFPPPTDLISYKSEGEKSVLKFKWGVEVCLDKPADDGQFRVMLPTSKLDGRRFRLFTVSGNANQLLNNAKNTITITYAHRNKL